MTIYEFEREKHRDLSLRPELLLLAVMLAATCWSVLWRYVIRGPPR